MLYGRELSPEELEAIRAQIEGFNRVAVDEEMRKLIAEWPHLLAKLKPRPR
jgi:hypothetical protein